MNLLSHKIQNFIDHVSIHDVAHCFLDVSIVDEYITFLSIDENLYEYYGKSFLFNNLKSVSTIVFLVNNYIYEMSFDDMLAISEYTLIYKKHLFIFIWNLIGKKSPVFIEHYGYTQITTAVTAMQYYSLLKSNHNI